MEKDFKKKVIKPLCIYSLAFSMLLPSVASLADLDINLGGYGVVEAAGIEVKAPTVKPVFYDATTISGGNLAKYRDKAKKKTFIATVHVTLKGKDGTVKATLSDSPTSGTTWSVKLPEGKKVEEGDKITVYQQIGDDKSTEVNVTAKAPKASTVTLTMPTGEIWIEQTSSNIVNEDEQAEAVKMLKDANTEIASDIKSVKFSIDGTNHAYYEVTYTDDSTSGKIKATNLKINQVTETSRGATLGSITIIDNVIKGKLEGTAPFTDIKVQIVVKLSDAGKGSFCNEKGCTVDKTSSNPVDATVDSTTGEFSYTIDPNNPIEKIELGNVVGVSVKEKNKFKSCSKTTVTAPIPEKTEVKDPRKLTADDKKAIDAAIRKAYTVNGVSKLPNGTGDWKGVPAVIQIDDSGNVKIFSGNDVEVTYDSNWNPVPVKNADGSLKVKEDAKPIITIQGKDLLKNIKPEAPTFALSGKNITITPNEKDTDAKIITVSYKDKDGKDQTTTATKADDGTWSIAGEGTVVNGVITLPKDKVKGGTDVTAKVTDKGGVADDDKEALTSEPGTLKVEETKADKVEALGGLDPVDIKKWVGDKVEWKDGVKAKDSASEENKKKINELLEEAKTTFEDDTRNTSAEGDFTGTIKVSFDDGSFIEVADQNLYVSNHVTSMERKDKVPTDALDVQLKLGEGVKVEDKDPNTGAVTKTTKGDKDNPVLYKEYKVKPGIDFSTYKHPTLQKTIFDLIDEKADEGYTEVVWKDSKGGTNFVAAADNNVFTATATKLEIKVKVTYDANGGSGTMDGAEITKGSTYKLLANGFTAPENQEFDTWEVDGKKVAPGTEITVDKDTVIKAVWKGDLVDIEFNHGEGNGEMKKETVTKGSKYKLPASTFTAPEGKEFDGWMIGNEKKSVGDEITVKGNVTLVAQWKPIGEPGKPGEEPGTKPEPKPNEPGDNDFYIPEFKIHEEVVPTYPVYAVVPKTEKVEKVEKVPVSLETHKAYIAGYEDNTLRAEGNLTRAEAAAMVTRLAGLDLSDNSMPAFKDMQKNAWYFRYINAAVKAKMLDADNGMMRPNDKITRAEFAKMLAAIDKENSSVSKFDDIKGHRYEKEINKIYGNNRIEGYEDGSFRPDAYLTRAESAAFLNRMFNRIADKEAYAGLEDKLAKFKDFDASKWYYDEMVEATNSHELTRRGKASDKFGRVYEKWTRILPSDVK